MIDYLKIDIEYSEWDSLEAIIKHDVIKRVTSGVLANIKQLGIELHTREINKMHTSSVKDYIHYSTILSGLRAAGFRRWYWNKNLYGLLKSKLYFDGSPISCCYEMIYINTNYLL